MDNIILIGMPGSGKSTVGVVLAKVLGYGFLDADVLIQQREGKTLHEILDSVGPWGFNKIEEDVNLGISVDHTVIATGGSAVYGERAMRHFANLGTIVYLRVSCEEMIRRVDNVPERGISVADGVTLQELYRERAPLYEKYADLTVDVDGCDISKSVTRLRAALAK
ncbi:MAG: shikimate kinase [Anaerovoracaceae bacterium]|jgi:shikimate kinase